MSIGEILKIISLAWSIFRELKDFYLHLEEKYDWGRDKTSEEKLTVREKKKAEFDEKLGEIFENKGLPTPNGGVREYFRELIHNKLEKKKEAK